MLSVFTLIISSSRQNRTIIKSLRMKSRASLAASPRLRLYSIGFIYPNNRFVLDSLYKHFIQYKFGYNWSLTETHTNPLFIVEIRR